MLERLNEMVSLLGKITANGVDSGLSLVVLIIYIGAIILIGKGVWSGLKTLFNGEKK